MSEANEDKLQRRNEESKENEKGEVIVELMLGRSEARKGAGLSALLLRTGASDNAVTNENEPITILRLIGE